MDEFLRGINAAIFWQYIRNYQYENNMQVTVTNETIIIKTAYSYSEINAYDQQIF